MLRAPHSPQGLRAGIVSRVAADLFDAIVVAVVGVVAAVVVATVRTVVGVGAFAVPELGLPGAASAGPALFFAYLAFFWSTSGRTFGKQVVGLRVLDASGDALGVARATLRAALCVLFPVGLLWVLVSKRNSSLQDVLVRTVVAYDWRPRAPQARVPARAR